MNLLNDLTVYTKNLTDKLTIEKSATSAPALLSKESAIELLIRNQKRFFEVCKIDSEARTFLELNYETIIQDEIGKSELFLNSPVFWALEYPVQAYWTVKDEKVTERTFKVKTTPYSTPRNLISRLVYHKSSGYGTQVFNRLIYDTQTLVQIETRFGTQYAIKDPVILIGMYIPFYIQDKSSNLFWLGDIVSFKNGETIK
jgi:hypothetical protein